MREDFKKLIALFEELQVAGVSATTITCSTPITITNSTISCSTLTACSTFTTYTIDAIATTTYTAPIFTTTQRPPGLAEG